MPLRQLFADSSVVIAGAISHTGASRDVLIMAEIGLYQLVLSHQVIDECERNLQKKHPAVLPYFAQLLAHINLVVVPNPVPLALEPWLPHIEAKDAPILVAALDAKVDRLLTLNPKDFTQQIAQMSGLTMQSPGEFIEELRTIVTARLQG